MFVEAIINENIDTEFSYLEIGEKIHGNVKSYNQDFMNIDVVYDVTTECDAEGNIIDANYDMGKKRLKIKKGTIKKVYCGCGNPATREIQNELLCEECEYEDGEDFSFLSSSPFSF